MNGDLPTNVGVGAAGLFGGAMILRGIWTWLGRQGLISQGDSSQKDLLSNLTAEAERWRKMHEDSVKAHEDSKKQHEATLVLLGEIKLQNKMLRILLIQRGMTAQELDIMLGAIDVH